ncbi:non-homologous end joining protein Ku [Paraburkholderia sp. SOS3]|uniref:non-homologous end joining protein Ku n=1 Tax=Paraburkholderia sp. SOS3 TaxID=1926494 RepID=UPI000947706E|nr:Ku protein [Paraburkholderia sp. SOS3]APR36086.1 Ku protein [Paraburkholderia sp. SOS3]
MAHMIWKGAISFGLVHVPVQLYPATQSEKVGFNLLDKRSIDPIGYKQINKRTGKEVTRENIVRGFEYEKGKYVVMSDAEIRSANPESTQTVDILAFVEAPDISFLYLDTPYYLTPDRKGEKVYALLREALKESGKIGIANVVMHNKQHLAALIPIGPVLALNTLRWAGEVRSYDELKLPDENRKKAGVTPRELEMAKKLIDDMSDAWDPSAYHDTFHDDIMALVDRKVSEGRTEEIGEVDEPADTRPSADILDLSELLKRSLGKGKAAGARKSAAKADGKATAKPARARASRDEDAEQETGANTRRAPRRAAKSKATTRRSSGGASSTAVRKRRAA